MVVSNQSGVARGYYTGADVKTLHARVAKDLREKGVDVAGFYFCPHGPGEGCACRRPAPGLLVQAEKDLNIDFARSFPSEINLLMFRRPSLSGFSLFLLGRGTVYRKRGLSQRKSPSRTTFSPRCNGLKGD